MYSFDYLLLYRETYPDEKTTAKDIISKYNLDIPNDIINKGKWFLTDIDKEIHTLYCYMRCNDINKPFLQDALLYIKSRDFTTSRVWLAECLGEGIGIQQCYMSSEMLLSMTDDHYYSLYKLRRYRKSANLGYVPAIYELAKKYWSGEDGIVSRGESFKLYQKCANLGHAGAQYIMYLFYKKNIEIIKYSFINKNHNLALQYLQKSVVQNHPNAIVALIDEYKGNDIYGENKNEPYPKIIEILKLCKRYEGIYKPYEHMYKNKYNFAEEFEKFNNSYIKGLYDIFTANDVYREFCPQRYKKVRQIICDTVIPLLHTYLIKDVSDIILDYV